MPRPRSKRDLASDDIEQAISWASKALSMLGGRVRYGSRKLPPDNNYVARGYLESVITRLAVARELVDRRYALANPDELVNPRDDFEREYDRTRHTGCDNATS